MSYIEAKPRDKEYSRSLLFNGEIRVCTLFRRHPVLTVDKEHYQDVSDVVHNARVVRISPDKNFGQVIVNGFKRKRRFRIKEDLVVQQKP